MTNENAVEKKPLTAPHPQDGAQPTKAGPGKSRRKGPKHALANRGFLSLLGVSFFGAANDTILKQILIVMVAGGGLWVNRLGDGTQGVVGLVLTLPFIFLSGFAGKLADKYSKRLVIVWVKIAEVPIAIFAFGGLLFGSFWMSLIALLLLAIQSSFYGPAKFGSIPDLVSEDRLSQANGLITAVTNVSIIVATLSAGYLADLYYPTIPESELAVAETSSDSPSSRVTPAIDSLPPTGLNGDETEVKMVPDPNKTPQRVPAGLALIGVAIVGLFFAFNIPKMDAVDPGLKISDDVFATPMRRLEESSLPPPLKKLLKLCYSFLDFLALSFSSHVQTFKDANRPLLVVLFSWSGFYMIGMLALLLLPDYREILLISNQTMGIVIGLLAVSIGAGSIFTAILSGKTIRPYFALFGAAGMTLTFLVMGIVEITLLRLQILVFLIGFFAGFYIVPLQSLLQFLSPSDERGRFFGTANALSFVFTSGASLLYWWLKGGLGVPTERVPLVCAGLALVGTLVGMFELNRIMAAQKSLRISLHSNDSDEQA